MATLVWPPTLGQLKTDLRSRGETVDDVSDDDQLLQVLEPSISFVEDKRAGWYNFAGDLDSELPAPPPHLVLGTIRLAGRWHKRRRSPDGMVDMGELGAAQIAMSDPDIERMLGIGRWRPPEFA